MDVGLPRRLQIVLTFDGGGLCNRIFPFANAIAAGMEHGVQVVNPVFNDYRKYFRGSCAETAHSPDATNSYPLFDLPLWKSRFRIQRQLNPGAVHRTGESNPIDLDKLIPEHRERQRVWIEALYCLANESFIKHADELRAYFRPIRSIEERVFEWTQQARVNTDLLIGVHIRQGDYKNHDNGMLFYETKEYAEVMQKVAALFPSQKIRFLVCSNVTQNKQELSALDWTPGPGGEIEDLYALATCDYLVGASSSYTQWASFFGRVPRLVYNRKYEERQASGRTPIAIESFHTHQYGFGRFANSLS